MGRDIFSEVGQSQGETAPRVVGLSRACSMEKLKGKQIFARVTQIQYNNHGMHDSGWPHLDLKKSCLALGGNNDHGLNDQLVIWDASV